MPIRVEMYYKGTHLVQSFESIDKFNEHISFVVRHNTLDNTIMLNELDSIEQTYYDYTNEKYPEGYFGEQDKLLKKIFNDGTYILVQATWFSNIVTLIHRGVLVNDNMNGYVVMDSERCVVSDIFLSIYKCCKVCKIKCDSKCSKCSKVWYCSREHQKQDWKNHKKDCCK